MNSRAHVLPLVLVLALAGCTSNRSPLALDAGVGPETIEDVVVLPVIDARPSPFDQVQVANKVGEAMVRALRDRGYITLAADAWGQRPTGSLDLHVATAEQLSPLAPDDADVFVLVQVEKLERSAIQTESTYEARLSAVMVDRPRGRVVWRDVATASTSLAGVLTIVSRESVQYDAAINAAELLVESLPERKKVAKR